MLNECGSDVLLSNTKPGKREQRVAAALLSLRHESQLLLSLPLRAERPIDSMVFTLPGNDDDDAELLDCHENPSLRL